MSASEQPKFESKRVESPNDRNVALELNVSISDAERAPAPTVTWLPPDEPVAGDSSASSAEVVIKSIGRYRVDLCLGQGGFGTVYLAMDEELNRRVAIKVPKRLAAAQVAEYTDEAQKLAKLEHPGVVPIYDIGHTAEFPVFLVTKYIEGARWPNGRSVSGPIFCRSCG